MHNQEIKEFILQKFAVEFDIESRFDSNNDSFTQSFEIQVGHEWNDENDEPHDCWMDVCGTIYVKRGSDNYHNCLKDGRSGENQGEANSIESFEFNEITFFIDSVDNSNLIEFEDLDNVLNLKLQEDEA